MASVVPPVTVYIHPSFKSSEIDHVCVHMMHAPLVVGHTLEAMQRLRCTYSPSIRIHMYTHNYNFVHVHGFNIESSACMYIEHAI